MTTYDVTSPVWGHNVNFLHWDRDEGVGRAAAWLTPRPVVGDILVVRSEHGFIPLEITNITHAPNVDDMVFVDLKRYVKPETFDERVERIKHDHNISEKQAISVAKSEINIETMIRRKKES